jgi:hypothetical protein
MTNPQKRLQTRIISESAARSLNLTYTTQPDNNPERNNTIETINQFNSSVLSMSTNITDSVNNPDKEYSETTNNNVKPNQSSKQQVEDNQDLALNSFPNSLSTELLVDNKAEVEQIEAVENDEQSGE